MSQYPTTYRDLTGNPAVEAMELRDFGAADCAPTLDADCCPDADDYPSDDDFARMEAENERFKRDAATVFGGNGGDDDTDPTPPAGLLPVDVLSFPASAARFSDDELVTAIYMGDAEPERLCLDPARRQAWLSAMTSELLRRVAT